MVPVSGMCVMGVTV